MLKQEFATGHQCPQEIFHDPAAFGLGCHLENILKPFTFRVAGAAGEAEQVGFVDNIAVALRDHRVYTALFATEVIIERVAIGEVKHLHHAGFVGAFAFASDLALITPEGLEEVRSHGGVGELQRAGPVAV